MTRLALEQVTDFGDFTRGNDLKEYLKQSCSNISSQDLLKDVRLSPDGRHIHVIVRQPKSGLMTCDRYQRAHLMQYQKHVDLVLSRSAPIVDVIYIPESKAEDETTVIGVILENGRAEFWKFTECRSGWNLMQTVDLCNGPRAKVMSVCVCQSFIIWCEERPPSESFHGVSSNFRYCICKKTVEVKDGRVSLGNVQIALHNNPRYHVISSGDLVYMLPAKDDSSTCVYKFFLAWSLDRDAFSVLTASSGLLHLKSSNKESDFKRLVMDCIGILSTINPPNICGFSATGYGDLLLLLSSGWVSVMKRDGRLWNVYKLPDNSLSVGGTHSLKIYNDILALTVGKTLFLIDTKSGLEIERIGLKREALLFVNSSDSHVPQMLCETGLHVVRQKSDFDATTQPPSRYSEAIDPSALLVEAVFEEACKYYQQRSLSSAQLTVEKIKNEGMFQAPISLADILKGYLKAKLSEKNSSQERLMNSLESELKTLVKLEESKASMLKASEKDLETFCDSLVQQEIFRLLSSDLDRENLQYLNSIFNLFPASSWSAVQLVLQLKCNRENSLSSKAPAELWKIILSPVQTAANFARCNGEQKNITANAVLPVFELLCKSIFKFQTSWLPRFLELAQQQAGASSTSSWSFGVKESSDSLPLYKRALMVLPSTGASHNLEVELLLCSQRPNAIIQALRILIDQRQWERVAQVAERFCRQSPLLNKEIFSTLLCEVSQHRDLDAYLDLLWNLCPEDMNVTSIINIVLQNLPSLSQEVGPFQPPGGHMTMGLLKPLLRKVLQRETKPSQRYADILQSPTHPPLTPPRHPKELIGEPEQKPSDSSPHLF